MSVSPAGVPPPARIPLTTYESATDGNVPRRGGSLCRWLCRPGIDEHTDPDRGRLHANERRGGRRPADRHANSHAARDQSAADTYPHRQPDAAPNLDGIPLRDAPAHADVLADRHGDPHADADLDPDADGYLDADPYADLDTDRVPDAVTGRSGSAGAPGPLAATLGELADRPHHARRPPGNSPFLPTKLER